MHLLLLCQALASPIAQKFGRAVPNNNGSTLITIQSQKIPLLIFFIGDAYGNDPGTTTNRMLVTMPMADLSASIPKEIYWGKHLRRRPVYRAFPSTH